MDFPVCPACGQSVIDDDVEDCPFCGSSMTAKLGAKPAAPKPLSEQSTTEMMAAKTRRNPNMLYLVETKEGNREEAAF